MFRRIVSFVVAISFICTQTGFAQMAAPRDISGIISRAPVADSFRPVHMRSLTYDLGARDLQLLLDKGDAGKTVQEETAKKLFEYFQVGITLPNSVFFVNLRPDSRDSMIAPELARTDMGKVLLQADLQLKKDLCQLTSPDCKEGKEYWSLLYAKAESIYGTDQVTIPTITRPWIVPGEIIVREGSNSAYIYKATLKVQLEQDYLKNDAQYNFSDSRQKALNEYSTQILKEMVLPTLVKKVNSSAVYAPLRQVYYSLIFAQWFKQHFSGKAGVYSSSIDTSDLTGLVSRQSWDPGEYFQAYKTSFSQGEYNKEIQSEGPSGLRVRKYTSGGVDLEACFAFFNRQGGLVDIAANGVIPEMLADPDQMVKVNVDTAGAVSFVPIAKAAVEDGGVIKLDQKKIDVLQAKYSAEGIRETINDFIADKRREMSEIYDTVVKKTAELKQRRENKQIATEKEAVQLGKEANAPLDKLIDPLNAREVLKKKDNLKEAEVQYIDDLQDDKKALQGLLDGELAINMPFAGAGTRMENSLAELEIRLGPEDTKLANLNIWKIADAMGIRTRSAHAKELGLSERAMLALEQGIRDFAKTNKLTPDQIQKKMKLIVSVSDDIEKQIFEIFSKPSRISNERFFGFDPENVVFINGGYGIGYVMDKEGNLSPSKDSAKQKVSWNHGFAFIETTWVKGPAAYTLGVDKQGQVFKKGLDTPVAQYVLNRGAQYACIHRINDLILLHPKMALDVQMFGAFKNLISMPENQDVNMLLEMAANPTDQKGGLALTENGKDLILLEGLATNDKGGEIKKKMKEVGVNPPYNRLYGYYKIADVAKAMLDHPFPFVINQKDGVLSPELPTGDITWVEGVHARAAMRKNDILIDQDILPNEQRNDKNEPKKGENGEILKAYQPGSGMILHDCKAAMYVKDGVMMVDALDDPARKLFEPRYYVDDGGWVTDSMQLWKVLSDEEILALVKEKAGTGEVEIVSIKKPNAVEVATGPGYNWLDWEVRGPGLVTFKYKKEDDRSANLTRVQEGSAALSNQPKEQSISFEFESSDSVIARLREKYGEALTIKSITEPHSADVLVADGPGMLTNEPRYYPGWITYTVNEDGGAVQEESFNDESSAMRWLKQKFGDKITIIKTYPAYNVDVMVDDGRGGLTTESRPFGRGSIIFWVHEDLGNGRMIGREYFDNEAQLSAVKEKIKKTYPKAEVISVTGPHKEQVVDQDKPKDTRDREFGWMVEFSYQAESGTKTAPSVQPKEQGVSFEGNPDFDIARLKEKYGKALTIKNVRMPYSTDVMVDDTRGGLNTEPRDFPGWITYTVNEDGGALPASTQALRDAKSPEVVREKIKALFAKHGYSLSDFKKIVDQKEVELADLEKIKGTMPKEDYKKAKAALEKARDEYIDTINAEFTGKMMQDPDVKVGELPQPGDRTKNDDGMVVIEKFQNNLKAIKAMAGGKLALSMPFAGAGNRMDTSLRALGITLPADQIRLANINIWKIAGLMGDQEYDKAVKAGNNDAEARAVVKAKGLICTDEVPAYALQTGFGERAMLALEQGILNLRKEPGVTEKDINDIFDNMKIVVSVSSEIETDIFTMFFKKSRLTGRQFFGFKPENVVFVKGGYGPGYEVKGNELAIKDGQADTAMSWNHGFAFEELNWITGEESNWRGTRAYTLTGKHLADGSYETRGLDVPVQDYVGEKGRGAEFSCVHRINDLILLHPDMAIDAQMFGAFLTVAEERPEMNVMLEMAANPTKQKGGWAFFKGGWLKLFETLATKTDTVTNRLNELGAQSAKGIPYNRLYGYYKIKEVSKALKDNGGMPMLIDHKKGIISPEIPTGDITLVPGINAVGAYRMMDRIIKEGLTLNQKRDGDNEVFDKSNPDAPAWEPKTVDGITGTGLILHDCKEAKYIKDALLFVSLIDNPEGKTRYFGDAYYAYSAFASLKDPETLLYQSRQNPELLVHTIRYLEAQDKGDPRLVPLYETALKVRNLVTPVMDKKFVEQAVFDPASAEDIKKAGDNVQAVAEAMAAADEVSVNLRIEFAAKLRDRTVRDPKDVLKGYTDMHTHTVRSDGEFSPLWNVFEAWRHGMAAIGVVDHSTFAHFDELISAAKVFPDIRIVPGIEVEFSTPLIDGHSLEFVHAPVYAPAIEKGDSKACEAWLAQLKKNGLAKELERCFTQNNIKQEFFRQRFNASVNAAQDPNNLLSISLADYARFSTDFRNWNQIVPMLKKKYGGELIDSLAAKAGMSAADAFVNKNVVAKDKDTVRPRNIKVDFWKNGVTPNSRYGIDLGELLVMLEELSARMYIAHPKEDRNYWQGQEEKKKYAGASAQEKASMFVDVLRVLVNAYPKFADRLEGLEIYSAKNTTEERDAFAGRMADIEKIVGKKLVWLIGSDAHNNGYDASESNKRIGSGDKGNLMNLKVSDGGDKTDKVATPADKKMPGGIDMRGLPINSQPLLYHPEAAKVSGEVARMSLAELQGQWKMLEKRVRMGLAPYGEINQYVSACVNSDEKGQVELVHKCIADMLRKEELTGQDASPEVRDILYKLN